MRAQASNPHAEEGRGPGPDGPGPRSWSRSAVRFVTTYLLWQRSHTPRLSERSMALEKFGFTPLGTVATTFSGYQDGTFDALVLSEETAQPLI